MLSPKQIRVLVVDDHPLMRLGVSAILRSQSDMVVVAEAGTAEEAIENHRLHTPDVTVLDLGLPGADGLTVIRTVRARLPQAKFVVLTNFGGVEDIHQALSAGAQGYVVKGMSNKVLLEAVRRIDRGGRYLPRPLAEILRNRSPNADLTPREREVLHLVVEGLSNRQIGQQLGITEATVKRHMGAILMRMEVTDRTQAVVTALRRGLAHL